MNKIMTYEDVKKDIEDSEYKRVALFNKHGENLVPWNSKNITITRRLTEVRGRLQSKATDDGVYQIHAKHHGAKAVPSVYYVQVGEGLADIEIHDPKEVNVIETKEIEYAKSGFVSMDTHNELFKKNLELEFKIRELEAENKNLNDELDDMVNEEPEQKEGFLSDNTTTFLKQSFENFTPLIEKYMEQRDKRLQLDYLKVMNADPRYAQQQKPLPQHPKQEPHLHETHEEPEDISEEEETYIVAMENLKQSHPDLYKLAMERAEEEQRKESA